MFATDHLYRLPWTRHDNPNGWLEPTTHCQLQCPGCYRGVDRDGFQRAHAELDELKRDVDDLIRLRGVRTISIAGGDPFMYPLLSELIAYVRSCGVDVMLVTNGIALSEARVRQLKDEGVGRVLIHVDKHQGRKGVETLEDTHRVRAEHCEMFRRIGGISLGFSLPVGPEDLDDLPAIARFFQENADVVDLVNFNRMEPSLGGDSDETDVLDGATMFERVAEAYGMDYCAYLGKTHSDEASWVFGQAVFSGRKLLGCLDPKAFEFIHERYYEKTGVSGIRAKAGKLVGPALLALAPFNKSLRSMALRLLGLGKARGPLNLQLVLCVNSPSPKDGDWDRCEGCPDAMMYEGDLVPSCLVERVRNGEHVTAA